MTKSSSPTPTTATPDISPVAYLPGHNTTPGLVLFLLDNGPDSALIIGDNRGGDAHVIELADWPPTVIDLLRAHAAHRAGQR